MILQMTKSQMMKKTLMYGTINLRSDDFHILAKEYSRNSHKTFESHITSHIFHSVTGKKQSLNDLLDDSTGQKVIWTTVTANELGHLVQGIH